MNARALMLRARLGAVLLAGVVDHAGCTGRSTCGGTVRLELRDGAGALELRVADALGGGGARPGDLDLCDPAGRRLGALAWEGDALRLLDRDGAEHERVTGLQTSTPRGDGLHLYRGDHVLRVLRPDGVPYGALAPVDSTHLLVSDPAGVPLAKVAVDRDGAALVSSPDGVTPARLKPSPGLEAAGLFAFQSLSLEERTLLAVQVARSLFHGN